MMQVDTETCEYYAALEDVSFKYLDYQREQNEKKIKAQLKAKEDENKRIRKELKRMRYPNPESLYEIYDKQTGELLYVGRDTSKKQRRYLEHLTGRSNVINAKY